jgi:hypothetical protein
MRVVQGDGPGHTGYEILEKVLKDASYDAGLILAAKRVAGRLKQTLRTSDNFYDDILNSFIEAGNNLASAQDKTWNVLGVIATGGSNLASRLILNDSTSRRKLTSLNILSTVPGVLDLDSAASGHIYSFPKSVKLGCETGKNYHFWYTAYLARQATLETGQARASAVAAFQLAKATRVSFNSSNQAVDLSSLDRPYMYIMRADIADEAAGAVFGAFAAMGKTPNLDVNSAIADLIRTTGQGDPGPASGLLTMFPLGDAGAKFKAYEIWMESFNPNMAFTELSSRL